MRLLLATLLALLVGAPALAAPNVVVISMDTTRADALSCYGGLPGLPETDDPISPNLDALAAEGLRFERFFAHAPTTLSSHTSMLSGRDPHQHAVVRNGFQVPEGLPTLAERFRDQGYDTVAVVAAAALEGGMGLDRGFRVYDDHTPERHGLMYQQRARGVVGRTLRHLADRDADRPLFLFVHLYDPHAPYDAPGSFRDRFTDPAYDGPYRELERGELQALRDALSKGAADPADVAYLAGRYAGEVAYMDHWIGRLLDALGDQGLLDEAIVVATADHGEALSDDPAFAYTHGTDVNDGVMRVPLIVRGYGVPLGAPGVVRRQAEMAGLAPTIERMAGLPATLGHDFWDLVRPGPVRDDDGWPERPTRAVFMEATRPHRADADGRWNNLDLYRGVLAGGYGVRRAPAFRVPPTLDRAYELSRAASRSITATLTAMLARWDASAPPYRTEALDDDTRAALEALGYLE